MAVKRGKKQARRKDEPAIPGYVWLLAGLFIGAAVAVTAWMKFPHAIDDHMPHPNPAARPQVASAASDAASVPEGNPPSDSSVQKKRKYDFYEVLPEREVEIPDEELSAQVKAEAAANLASKQQAASASGAASTAAPGTVAAAHPVAAIPALNPAVANPPAASTATTHPVPTHPATAPDTALVANPAQPASVPAGHPGTPASAAVTATIPVPASELKSGQYLLQAGAFRNNQQADDLKARIAMLGLVGRVETVQTPAGQMHRVRLGPYATASELEAAKQKLGSGGMPAVAIRVK